MTLLPCLQQTVQELALDFDSIPAARKALLGQLSHYIKEKLTANKPIKLVFICTHNSRRSHMAQLWAQAAATYYGMPHVQCYSGGTEATAFHPHAVAAMQELGFAVQHPRQSDNPVYEVRYAPQTPPLMAWSKRFDDKTRPESGFCAVMTCSEADQNCPFVPGTERRLGLTYEDPKHFDETPQAAAMYLERARQIGTELLYAFQQVNS